MDANLPPGFQLEDAPSPEATSPASPTGLPPGFELEEDKYGSTGEQAKAGLEGVSRGLAGPLATYAEARMGLSTPEAMRARQEQNPVSAGVGEAVGLLGGALTGTGEAAVLEHAGQAATELAGLAKPASYAAKVGSSALKQAVEMAVYQGGDEASKMILQDPDASAQHALASMGLAAALGSAGGAFLTGAVSPLWKATVGEKVEGGLKALINHLGGAEDGTVARTSQELANQAGVDISPEIGSVIDDVPGARQSHSILSQDDTHIAGRAYQEKLQNLEDEMTSRVVSSLGRAPESIESLPKFDKYASGREMGETLSKELEPTINDLSARYEQKMEQYKNAPLDSAVKRNISEQISKKALEEGWAKSIDSDNMRLVSKMLDKLPEQTNLEDLKNMASNLWRSHDAPDLKAAMEIRKVLQSNLEDAITGAIAHGSPEKAAAELSNYSKLRSDYRALSQHLENLDEYLKVGKWNGPKSFLTALKDMSTQRGERIADRLLGDKAANVLEVLKATPDTLNKVKEHHVNELLREAVQKAPAGKQINTRNLVKNINTLTPQVQDLLLNAQQKNSIEGVAAIQKALEDPTHNWSNTARTAEKKAYGTISPVSMVAALMGHGGAGALSFLGSLGMSEAKPALRLGLMKLMASDAPVNAAGFKSMVSFIDAAQKGAKIIDLASLNVLRPGAKVLLDSQVPTTAELTKLDKMVTARQDNPNDFMQAQSDSLGHYMAPQQTAMVQATAQSLQYLQSLKPQPQQLSPLDKPIPPSTEQTARYNRALEIAQQPAIVLQHVKDGTIQVSDLQDLKAMHPAVYQTMTQKLTNHMMSNKANEEPIPYKTRMGISLFLGQPMDSTMQPQAIQAAQPQPKPQPPQQPQGKTKKGTTTLGKSNKSYQTSTQSAESDRGGRE